MNELELVEAVYYPSQVPTSLESLSLLACVFDRVHFPGVYLPKDFDEIAAGKELERLRGITPYNLDGLRSRMCLQFALHRHYVDDLCFFTGVKSELQPLEPGTGAIAEELQIALSGPRPEGFIPDWWLGFSKGMPGTDECINAPGSQVYPANSLLYAARLGLPLINDDPYLPVPGLPGAAKNNTKLLTTILALECVRLVLPRMPVLAPREIAEFRSEVTDQVRPFRLALLRLAGDLNAMLASDVPIDEVQRAAKALVESKVYPALEELRLACENPGKPWHKRAVGFFKDVPDLAQSYFTLPKNIVLAKLFAKVAVVLGDVRDEQLEARGTMGRSGLHYLLRLPQAFKARD